MRDELNVVCRKSLLLAGVIGLTLAVSTQAVALKAGHGRVDSASGTPLRVTIPLLEVTAADGSSLQAKLASPDAWAKAGLTPPVSLDSIAVSVEAGFTKDSRTLVLRSNQTADKQIVDVLVEVTSASGSTQVQSSFLVLTRANAGTAAGSVLVKVGDTLSGIALANPVAGADLYQLLWALYEANPQAFFSQNMNLLKAGVTLKIPDAQTVRAIDPQLARDRYQQHLKAFNGLRGNSAIQSSAQRAPTVAAPKGATQSSSVSTASAAPTPAAGADRVLLTSSSTAEQKEDARVAAAKEIAEIQSRVDSLQQNVQQLKNALNQTASSNPGAGAAGTPGAAGTAGAVGTPGATGTTGTSGTPGALGTPGTSGSAGSLGAGGVAGATGTAGATGSSDVNGAASAAGSATAPGPSAPTSGAAPTAGSASQTAQSMLTQFWSKFSTSPVGILTAVLAIGGLLVALMLRRASARREAEGDDLPEPLNPLTRTALDQKLQGIDLNLDSTNATAKIEPSLAASSSSPKI